MIDAVTQEVRGLAPLHLEGLREEGRWRYGPPPKLRSVDLPRRLLAWRIQSQARGGLTPEIRRLLVRPVAAPAAAASCAFSIDRAQRRNHHPCAWPTTPKNKNGLRKTERLKVQSSIEITFHLLSLKKYFATSYGIS